MTIRALVFDAYGTLYNVQTVLPTVDRLCPGKGELITQIWRLKQLEYAWLRTLLEEYEDFWSVTRASLDFALRAAEADADETVRDGMMDSYLHLDPYPEAIHALEELKGHKLAILSNGSPGMLNTLIRNSGLDRWIERAISVDRVRSYKPNPSCYKLVESELGISKQNVLFVSSNGFDVAGAKAFGFNVAWVRRSDPGSRQRAPGAATTIFRLLRSHAEELGYAPDHIISALTDLPKAIDK